MTRIDLLNVLKAETLEATKDLIMPVRQQESDEEQPNPRAADIYLMRLSDSKAAKKKVPYIIHQVITGKDGQQPGEQVSSEAVVRSIFCVYNENEEEGALMLLNLMERLRIHLLRKIVIGDRYQLDLTDGLESLVYPDDTAPYYMGEMSSVWKMPKIQREVNLYGN